MPESESQPEPEPVPELTGEVGEWKYKSVGTGVIRAGAAMDSEKVGKLEQGEQVRVDIIGHARNHM